MTRRLIIILALLQACFLVGVLYIFTNHVYFFDFVCDDAFISFRYAENLVNHGELSYNLGQRTEGYSNFLWTLLIAAGVWLGGDAVNLSKTLGWIFGALGIFLVWRVGIGSIYQTFIRGSQPPWGGAARYSGTHFSEIVEQQTALLLTAALTFMAPLILALSSSYAAWSSGGLETQAFTFFLAAAIFRFLLEERVEALCMENMMVGRPRRWSGLLFALAAMTRPEGAAFFGFAAAWRIGKLLLRRRRLAAATDAAGPAGPAGRFRLAANPDIEGLIFFLIPVAAWLMWKMCYYGDIVPSTFYVKGGGFEMMSRGWWDLARYLGATKMYILLPLLVLGWVSELKYFRRRWGGPASGLSMNFLIIVVVLFVLYYVWIGGDFMEMARFLVPALPFAALLAQEGILLLFNIAGAGRGRAGLYGVVLKWVFFFIVISFFAFYGQIQLAASSYAMTDHSDGGTDSIGYLKKAAEQWKIIGEWIKNDAEVGGRENATLATSAAGVIPYYSGLTTLDLLGLNDPLIPRMNLKVGNRPGHTHGADLGYIILWQADYFLAHPEINTRPKVLSQFDIGFMASMGYECRVITPKGLDPPYFQFWYRK